MVDRTWIIDRLGKEPFERLARELSGSELQSVLLEVMHERAGARSPKAVLDQFRRDGFCRPAPVDPRESLAVERELYEAAEGFEAIELSPVAPLGACSSFALTDQNRVLSALRSTEIVSDPTNVLALECALRMRESRAPLDFVTIQRVIRAQPVPKHPGFSQHFRIFVLASGGVETKDHDFTVETVVRHVRVMLSAFDRLERIGYSFGARRIDVLATEKRAPLGDRIARSLGAARKTLEHPYYSSGLRVMLFVTDKSGAEVPIADTGVFDWLVRLTSNRRAVFIASGMGAQLVLVRFRR